MYRMLLLGKNERQNEDFTFVFACVKPECGWKPKKPRAEAGVRGEGWGRSTVWEVGQGQKEDIPLYGLSYFLVFQPCECITYLEN